MFFPNFDKVFIILLDSQNNENEASIAAESSQYKHSTQSDAGIVYKSELNTVV